MIDIGAVTKIPIIGGAITGIIWGFIILVGMALVVGGVWLYINRRRHNIPIIIISERAGQNPKLTYDRGGYFKKKGQWIFKILGMKKVIAPPSPNYLHTSSKGKNILMLHQKGLDSFIPIFFSFPQGDLQFRVADMDTSLWADSMREMFAKTFLKTNWFQKYGNYVIFGITAMMCILLIYLTLQKFDTLTSGLGGIAKAMQHTADVYGACTQQVPAA